MPHEDLLRLLDDPAGQLAHADAALRRLAVSCCSGRLDEPGFGAAVIEVLQRDQDDRVRAEAAEALGTWGDPRGLTALAEARHDEAAVVREAVATSYGELRAGAAIEWLMDAAVRDEDSLVREAAVAALGAIGDARAVPLLLDLVRRGPPQVRRRAVVALTAFEGEDVTEALRHAAADRNPMVREAAEMVVGRTLPPR